MMTLLTRRLYDEGYLFNDGVALLDAEQNCRYGDAERYLQRLLGEEEEEDRLEDRAEV